MNSSRRLTTALVSAFVLSGGFTYLLSRRMERQATLQTAQTIHYVAPSRTLPPGAVLRAGDLRMIAWPLSSPVEGGFSRVEDVIGRGSLYPLDPGQPLLDKELTTAGSGAGLASKIPTGMRAIALRSDEVVGVAGFLQPGSHLDVLVTCRTAQSLDPTTATVLQNVIVIAAGSQVEPNPDGKPASTTVVTLLLTPQEAERAVLASTQGSIHFVLRNGTDGGRIDSAPIGLSQLTGSSAPHAPSISPSPLDARARRSRVTSTAAEHGMPFHIETILGDEPDVSKSTEKTAE